MYFDTVGGKYKIQATLDEVYSYLGLRSHDLDDVEGRRLLVR